MMLPRVKLVTYSVASVTVLSTLIGGCLSSPPTLVMDALPEAEAVPASMEPAIRAELLSRAQYGDSVTAWPSRDSCHATLRG